MTDKPDILNLIASVSYFAAGFLAPYWLGWRGFIILGLIAVGLCLSRGPRLAGGRRKCEHAG